MKPEKAVWKASTVFAPDFPRQSSSDRTIQARRDRRSSFCTALQAASENEMPGYYSVYSFPRGHSRDQNIPKINCIFIDLDVEGANYDPKEGSTDFEDWRLDMNDLLVRARMIANAILEENQEEHFRATLSGHKGLHLYLDFPTVSANNGDFFQFKNGLKTYGESVMSWLQSAAGGVNIDPWIDVDASDLGRLARHPNTVHHGAAYDDQTRWCVVITMEELADLHVDDYLELTTEPRWIDGYERNPSTTAGNKVVQAIRNASSATKNHSRSGSTHNSDALEEYGEQANEQIEVEDIEFLTSNYPCIATFQKRDDAFGHGNESHIMEVNVIGKLVELGTPRDVIHEFLNEIPGYDEDITDEQIDKIIARGYSSFNCEKIADRAPTFCLGKKCSIYKRADEVQK